MGKTGVVDVVEDVLNGVVGGVGLLGVLGLLVAGPDLEAVAVNLVLNPLGDAIRVAEGDGATDLAEHAAEGLEEVVIVDLSIICYIDHLNV